MSKPWKVKWVANPNGNILFTWQELDGVIKLWNDGHWSVQGPLKKRVRPAQSGFSNWEFAT
jgi:hypothetical protein